MSYARFGADLYVTFLLMLFVPTLAFSLLKAVLDSAGSGRLLRAIVFYFLPTSCMAALIGAGVAMAGYKFFDKSTPLEANVSNLSLGAETVGSRMEYDPHPFLTQIGKIIPTNPLGALSDPSGNSGLQVAFIAIVLGMVLVSLDEQQRRRISESLGKTLAVVIKDDRLRWRALSDYAELVTPLGVFFVSVTIFGALSLEMLKDLGSLMLIIAVALIVHTIVLLLWVRLKRNWTFWVKDGLVPGFGALVTAFVTASSFAALPAIGSVPLVSNDSTKRGILDLGTTLNKNGTAAYLAAAATFIALAARDGKLGGWEFVLVILTSAVAGIATAGLPFAAIFGLRMVLIATGVASGGLAWLILSIDPVIDRGVTVVNVLSNLVACSEPKEKAKSALEETATATAQPIALR